MVNTRTALSGFVRRLRPIDVGVERPLLWAGLLASMVACGIPLLLGIVGGWSSTRLATYSLVASCFVLLSQLPLLPFAWACWLLQRLPLYLLLMALTSLALQTLSGDPFLQPIVFTVPVVFAALRLGNVPTAAISLAFLCLMAVGLWLGGQRYPPAIIFPLLGYATAMVLIVAFTRLVAQHAAARQQADLLAADLALQRDYLARLVRITASLANELDPKHVLEQVALAGCELGFAGQARLWLRDEAGDESQTRLAASAPAGPTPPMSPEVVHVLQTAVVIVAPESVVLPLVFDDVTIGALELSALHGAEFTEADAVLLQPFADAAAVAIENALLYEQARASATLAERNRLARELHDTIAQGLTAVNMQLEAAQRAFDRDPQRARTRVHRAAELTKATLDDVRRSVWTLASPLADGKSFPDALRELVDGFSARTGMATQFTQVGVAPPVDPATASQVLRIVQEALHNVEKHARASAVVVQSTVCEGEWRIAVADNGRGFEVTEPVVGTSGGFGFISQRERARLIGGHLAVVSAAGAGTTVDLILPCAEG